MRQVYVWVMGAMYLCSITFIIGPIKLELPDLIESHLTQGLPSGGTSGPGLEECYVRDNCVHYINISWGRDKYRTRLNVKIECTHI
jgi:hypothetical protein